MKKSKEPIFFKSLFGVGTVVVLAIFMMIRGSKDKAEFYNVSGKITYLNKTYEDLPNRHHGKYRYLRVENYPKVFEIFIGKDWDDFKPKYEQIDSLKPGDIVSVYYDVNENEGDPKINRLAIFIDKDNKPVFILGNKYKIFGNIFFAVGFIFLAILFTLKQKGMIT